MKRTRVYLVCLGIKTKSVSVDLSFLIKDFSDCTFMKFSKDKRTSLL